MDLADSVETLGADRRTRTKNLGAEDGTRRRKCKQRPAIIERNKVVRKYYMRGGARKLFRMVMVLARV